MPIRILSLIALLFLFAPFQARAATPVAEDAIEVLNRQLKTATSRSEQSRLLCFRARNNIRLGKTAEARLDYNRAIRAKRAGWLMQEYGRFLYNLGEFQNAYTVAEIVLDEFPYLNKEALLLKKQAEKQYTKVYYEQNPPTIILDSRPDTTRITRHDLIRQIRRNTPPPQRPQPKPQAGSS